MLIILLSIINEKQPRCQSKVFILNGFHDLYNESLEGRATCSKVQKGARWHDRGVFALRSDYSVCMIGLDTNTD